MLRRYVQSTSLSPNQFFPSYDTDHTEFHQYSRARGCFSFQYSQLNLSSFCVAVEKSTICQIDRSLNQPRAVTIGDDRKLMMRRVFGFVTN